MAELPAVKRALRRLADESSTDDYRTVIDEAVSAVGDVRRAAEFVDDGGLRRLRTAVSDAESRGDTESAERGRDVVALFREYRRSARGRRIPETAAADGQGADESRRTDGRGRTSGRSLRSCEQSPSNYFRRGHGTPLPGGGQESRQ